jgi:hypothetical protein
MEFSMAKTDALDSIRPTTSRYFCRERDKDHVTWIDIRRPNGDEILLIHVTETSLVVHSKRIKTPHSLRARVDAALREVTGEDPSGEGFTIPLKGASQSLLMEVVDTALRLTT